MLADDPAPAMPKPGDVVAGKYRLDRVVGEGGMGVVYEATHLRLRQRVALKMLLPAMLLHEVLVSRFEREARAAARLRSRHVARVNDVDVTPEGMPYMVMDFLEGHDLQAEIDRRRVLEVGDAVDYVLQACAAMIEAHPIGIVHRDLKPSNLFLAREGDGAAPIVKVLDFGISKFTSDGDAKLTEANTIMGTALYMSPEQVLASHSVDARSDIWSLGVILYEALSGTAPWVGPPQQVAAAIVSSPPPSLAGFRPDLPPALVAIIHRTLERDPAARFPDVRHLAAALLPFAPVGSLGRGVAEAAAAVAPSSPRLLTPDQPSGSLLPVREEPDVARTALHARGVSAARSVPAGSGIARHRFVVLGGAMAVSLLLLALAVMRAGTRPSPARSRVPAASAERVAVASSAPPALDSAPAASAGSPGAAAIFAIPQVASSSPRAPASGTSSAVAPAPRPRPSGLTRPPGSSSASPAPAKPNGNADQPLFL
jgi:serine/threonine-protein kinase